MGEHPHFRHLFQTKSHSLQIRQLLKLRQVIKQHLRHQKQTKGEEPAAEEESITRKKAKASALESYSFDLTKAAEEEKLDPVVGRDKEIERLAQILCRRRKNNPILIGEPGVGKSAIVEGLAIRIAKKKISRALLNKRVVSLDIGSIVAGTKFRGQFEERIKSIITELKSKPDIILFIDELPTLVGAGGAIGWKPLERRCSRIARLRF